MSDDGLTIPTDIVGLTFPATRIPVTWRRTMNYAASVGDHNPRYFDDTDPERLLAPPMFAVATTWSMVTGMPEEMQRLLPPPVMSRIVHATESLLFHRPVRPGTEISLSGRVASLQPTRAGALLTLRFEAVADDDTPLFTEFVGALFRGVACPSAEWTVPKAEPPGTSLSAPDWTAALPISPEAAHLYDGCTDIVFPIHTSKAFARRAGLPDIVLQGTAALAMAAREVVNRAADGDPTRLAALSARFVGLIVPGQTIILEASHTAPSQLVFRILDAGGKPALQGTATMDSAKE